MLSPNGSAWWAMFPIEGDMDLKLKLIGITKMKPSYASVSTWELVHTMANDILKNIDQKKNRQLLRHSLHEGLGAQLASGWWALRHWAWAGIGRKSSWEIQQVSLTVVGQYGLSSQLTWVSKIVPLPHLCQELKYNFSTRGKKRSQMFFD